MKHTLIIKVSDRPKYKYDMVTDKTNKIIHGWKNPKMLEKWLSGYVKGNERNFMKHIDKNGSAKLTVDAKKFVIPFRETKQLKKSDPEKYDKYKTILTVAFRKAGIRVIKHVTMDSSKTRAEFGCFYHVKAANGNDVLPVYVDKKGNVELGVSSDGFVIGKINQMSKMIQNLKDFKKTDLDEGTIKLKSLIKESTPGFENRSWGDPLPTVEDITKKYQEKHGIKEGPADDDSKAADKIHRDLKNAIDSIEDGVALINKKLSSFNAPGLRVAFLYAIKKNINTQTQKFDVRNAHKVLNDYFK